MNEDMINELKKLPLETQAAILEAWVKVIRWQLIRDSLKREPFIISGIC